MKITATELKNNLGEYLRRCENEEIVISKNGRDIAVLRSTYMELARASREVLAEPTGAYETQGVQLTYEEFLSLTEGNEERFEYIDGQVYLLAAPRVTHQAILGDLFSELRIFFKGKQCQPFVAPFDITLKRPNGSMHVVQPDVLVICDLEDHINEKDMYMGTPTLMVEIISPSTARKDQIKKLDLYMSCGIKEYWVINPKTDTVQVYLFEDNAIKDTTLYKMDQTISSILYQGLTVTLG